MKSQFLGLILCLTLSYTFAQKSPVKFGDVSLDEMKMTRYEKDTTASAVILCDFGSSSIKYNQNTGFALHFERTRRLKILKKDGFEWADFEIALYSDGARGEEVSGLKAITYNLENGKVVESKVKSDGLIKEKYTDNINLVKVAFPNVKVGSVLEITYDIQSDFLMNFWDWEFQETIPVAWSEYRAAIPEFFNYDKYMQGYIPLDISDEEVVRSAINITTKERTGGSGWSATQTNFHNDKIDFNETRFRWASKDVPAFKAEPFITTYKDYISKINFELAYIKYPNQPIEPVLGSWEEINKKYIESDFLGRAVTGNGFLKKKVDELIAGKTSNEQKISAIFNYVRENISWDGTSRRTVDGSLKKVFDERKGSSAEVNLLVASMLEKAEVAVHPVLISTRDHGFVREAIPVTSQFNYVICLTEVNGKQVLLDATDKLLPIGVIPERCLNGNGLVISKPGHRWVKLTTPLKTKSLLTADLAFDSEATLKGKVTFDRSGYSAHRSRKDYFSKTENEYVRDLIGSHAWEISKSEFQNTKDIDQAFKETHQITINDHVTAAGDVIYLNPFVVMQEIENPFKSEKREYPVDFGSALEKMYLTKIVIPQGYAIEELPKPKIFLLPDNAAKYVFNAVVYGDVINITSHLQINKSLFIQDEYPLLREFYTMMVSKQAEQIVLKKK